GRHPRSRRGPARGNRRRRALPGLAGRGLRHRPGAGGQRRGVHVIARPGPPGFASSRWPGAVALARPATLRPGVFQLLHIRFLVTAPGDPLLYRPRCTAPPRGARCGVISDTLRWSEGPLTGRTQHGRGGKWGESRSCDPLAGRRGDWPTPEEIPRRPGPTPCLHRMSTPSQNPFAGRFRGTNQRAATHRPASEDNSPGRRSSAAGGPGARTHQRVKLAGRRSENGANVESVTHWWGEDMVGRPRLELADGRRHTLASREKPPL